MKYITLEKVINMVYKAINKVDERLLEHGEQVAYIMLKLLKVHGGYTDEEIVRICTVSMFHDIGAYKVTEREKIFNTDIEKPLYHAVYGSLFIKYFSPLSDLSNIILGHHLSAKDIIKRDINYIPNEALLLGLSDYISIKYLHNVLDDEGYLGHIKEYFLDKNIELFIEANNGNRLVNSLKDNSYKEELYSLFRYRKLSREEVIKYIKMLTFSIDFRSEATVKHTILVEAISEEIAIILGFKEEDIDKIKASATLHDIGKVAVPIEILEKPDKLSNDEFEIIKRHAIDGYNILSGLNIDDIRDIATLHHEKIDGTGYPFGIKGEMISVEARLVAVADILSALLGRRSYKDEFNEDKIKKILLNMSSENKIDSDIVNLVIENYSEIVLRATEKSKILMDIYENIKSEYNEILLSIS